jgi:hypothetical protein
MLRVTNTLAYYALASMTAKKSFKINCLRLPNTAGPAQKRGTVSNEIIWPTVNVAKLFSLLQSN